MDESSRLCALTPHGSSQSLLHQNGASVGRRCCHQVRGIGSKGAVLVNIWTFLVIVSMGIAVNPVIYLNVLAKFQITVSYGLLLACTLGFCVMVLITSPIAGLLASIYFGRYSTLNTGLWLMWAGSVFACALLILQWFFPEAQQNVFVSGLVIITLVFSVGLVLFIVNAVPFGLDQMPDASGEQISAFVFWHTWSVFAGFDVLTLLKGGIACCMHVSSSRGTLLLSLLAVALMSVILCSKYLLHGWLIIEPKGINPLKTFYGVLRFAAKHKIPVRRSAFTYWEEVKPSQLDLAKTKYGGPYTHEEVEDIKTCLRMVVVIASTSVTTIASCSYHMSMLSANPGVNENIYNHLLFLAGGSATVLGFLTYELLVRPLFKRLIPNINSLRRLGFSQTISIIASLLLLVITTVWYMKSNPTMCMFNYEAFSPLKANPNWIELPHNALTSSFFFLAQNAFLEFLCAQAPYILRGLLVGLGYSVALTSSVLGVGIFIAWRVSYQEKAPNSPSCGVWFYLFTTITATLGCVLWCAVAKWYKRREREEPDMCRIFAENYYDH